MQRASHPSAILPDGFDPDRLQRLLDLVGPDQAPILLAQLRLDLAGCADSIARAVPGPDWETLREASHVLISLAGSVGAMRLHETAQALNAAAHAAHPAALAGLLPQLRADLDTLIALVEATPAQAPR